MPIVHAFKEWAVAVEALAQGKTILLLRKGGIREPGGRFNVAHPQFWLYPTYEHQRPEWLKPDYAAQVQPVASGWHPTTVAIAAWAEITHVLPLQDAAIAPTLWPYHIWTADFVQERLNWKPQLPLHVLLLRTYRLPQPQSIRYRPEYGGCKSWIDLESAIALDTAQPALNDRDYTQLVTEIQSRIASASHQP